MTKQASSPVGARTEADSKRRKQTEKTHARTAMSEALARHRLASRLLRDTSFPLSNGFLTLASLGISAGSEIRMIPDGSESGPSCSTMGFRGPKRSIAITMHVPKNATKYMAHPVQRGRCPVQGSRGGARRPLPRMCAKLPL